MKKPHPRSVKGVCARNGIGRTTFYDEVNSGRLEITKIGNRTIVTEKQEAEWLGRCRQRTEKKTEVA
jgi:predicted site-specific integrase-resolvase